MGGRGNASVHFRYLIFTTAINKIHICLKDGRLWFFIVAFLYLLCLKSVFSQLRLSAGLRKVLFATALGTVALALAAHQLKRRRRRKKQIAPEKCGFKPGGVTVPILPTRRVSSVKKGWPCNKGESPKPCSERVNIAKVVFKERGCTSSSGTMECSWQVGGEERKVISVHYIDVEWN